MNKAPELIVMLTHNDRTVENAIEVFEAAKDAPATCWGFKEVGLPIPEMKILVQKMKEAGKKTFLEVVDYTEEGCLAVAKIGVECGFDALMGTLYFDSVRDMLCESGVEYLPFVGKLSGRPSVLDGTIEEIIAEAQDLVENKNIKGFDLLGYRYVGDAVKLNSEFVKSMDVPICLAGSIQSYQRLDEVKSTGAWAFTIGGAFFENKFDGTFAEQITKVVEYMNQ
ncbi:MAG: hypothetical protein VB081_08000 [Christensenella sp.]|uniref:hypothetical protein n=1 Tax=Christensenella sp. TaxID=1935934 RepID=UPI002B21D34F|nr:hypothetical protein [Christensenella sp.]MEA5003427.1 hypothetical protein [Christensenella sp.]